MGTWTTSVILKIIFPNTRLRGQTSPNLVTLVGRHSANVWKFLRILKMVVICVKFQKCSSHFLPLIPGETLLQSPLKKMNQKLNKTFHHIGLPSGTVFACGVMGREIESRQSTVWFLLEKTYFQFIHTYLHTYMHAYMHTSHAMHSM
jgi:hypothetical protein